MKLRERHEVTIAQEGEEIVADVSSWAGLVHEGGLETLEEGGLNSYQIVAVGLKSTGDTSRVCAVVGGGRADDQLVDSETVSVCLSSG